MFLLKKIFFINYLEKRKRKNGKSQGKIDVRLFAGNKAHIHEIIRIRVNLLSLSMCNSLQIDKLKECRNSGCSYTSDLKNTGKSQSLCTDKGVKLFKDLSRMN